MTSPVEWLPDGTPHSPQFGDIYRSAGTDGQGGLAQARHVFLGGCGLWPAQRSDAVSPSGDRVSAVANAGAPDAPASAPSAPDTAPPAWANAPQWHVLETGFGLGLNFLATWAAWRADPARPARLFFTSVEAWPVSAADLQQSARAFPDLHDLTAQLAGQWQAMLPGVHRLVFEDGAVQLTLCVGDARAMLREIDVAADSIFLDGFSPSLNPEMWDLPVLKAVARLARPGTRVATWSIARGVRDHLTQCGFALARRPGLPPKRDSLTGSYAPAWTPRHLAQLRQPLPESHFDDRHAVVVGAGIAGASVAASLAARGWRVTVLDAAVTPAAGASGLPAGIFAPHVSPDDGRLAQLTREGVRAMRRRCAALLTHGQDWADTGVLELPVGRERRLPPAWRAANEAHEPHPGLQSSRPAQAGDVPAWRADWERQHRQLASEPLWHVQAGWVRPAQLVRAQLDRPGIQWRGGCRVARLEWQAASGQAVVDSLNAAPAAQADAPAPASARQQWALFNDHGVRLTTADLVVLAAGPATATLVQPWCTPGEFPTHQVHGLITLGHDDALDTGHADDAARTLQATGDDANTKNIEYQATPLIESTENANTPINPINPINGHGSFLRGIPGDRGRFWCTGASFLRELPRGFDATTVAAEHQANQQRLAELLPVTAQRVRAQIRSGAVWHWHGARCTVADRVPLVGPLRPAEPAQPVPDARPAPWVCTAMGARGLTLGVLAGELLAAWVHGEPLPIARNLAAGLAAHRFMQTEDEA